MVKIKGFKFLKIVKNASILLIFGVKKQLIKKIYHTKYEQNQSIFDNFQNFGPFYFDNKEIRYPKFLMWY